MKARSLADPWRVSSSPCLLDGHDVPSHAHVCGDGGDVHARADEHAYGHGPEHVHGHEHGCGCPQDACSDDADLENHRCGFVLGYGRHAHGRGRHQSHGRVSDHARACGHCLAYGHENGDVCYLQGVGLCGESDPWCGHGCGHVQ